MNPHVEKMTTILIVGIMVVMFPGAMFSRFILSYLTYYMTSNNDAFELPFPYWWGTFHSAMQCGVIHLRFRLRRFPFDWKTPRGYLIAFTLQYIACMFLFLFIACSLSTGIGVYMFIKCLTKDIKNGLNSINEGAKINRDRVKISIKFNDIIHFHARSKQFSKIHWIDTKLKKTQPLQGNWQKIMLFYVFTESFLIFQNLLGLISWLRLHGAVSASVEQHWFWKCSWLVHISWSILIFCMIDRDGPAKHPAA